MEHRHLNHRDYTLAAIDDVIARGGRRAWVELREAARCDAAVVRKIVRVCRAHEDDPHAQRFHLWNYYAGRRTA